MLSIFTLVLRQSASKSRSLVSCAWADGGKRDHCKAQHLLK